MFRHLWCVLSSSSGACVPSLLLRKFWACLDRLQKCAKYYRTVLQSSFQYLCYADVAPPAATAGSSLSQGFLLLGFSACVPWPSNTVFGISLIPGIGCPVVMSSTMCAKEVGYGAGGSSGFAGAGITPLGASKEDSLKSSGCTPFVCGGGRPRALRYALYASKSTAVLYFLYTVSIQYT